MSSGQIERQRASFDGLVDSGVYSADFDHAPAAKAFVGHVLQEVAARFGGRAPLEVLDCGCGTGAWLHFIHGQLLRAGHPAQRLCGFDLSERMVEVAREKLRDLTDPSEIRPGNMLEPQSYDFARAAGGFDLVFTYDVIQQLPRARQIEACFNIVGALSPGGIALIFDNDSRTKFGRRMAVRKFMTRYFGLKLVPRYYCNAAYPPLERFRQRIADATASRAEIMVRADGIKRVLIVERSADDAASGPREKGAARRLAS